MAYYPPYRSIVIFLAAALLMIASKTFTELFHLFEDALEYIYRPLFKTCLLLLTILLIIREKLPLNTYFKHSAWYISGILLLFYLSFTATQARAAELNYELSQKGHWLYVAKCISPGLFEEFFFRVLLFSLILNSYLPKSTTPYFKSILLSSMLFGLAHLNNLFYDEYHFMGVVNQVLSAFSIGAIFQMLFIKTRNILLVSFLHALVNYHGMKNVQLLQVQTSETDPFQTSDIIISLVAFSIIALLTTLYCYRFSKMIKQQKGNSKGGTLIVN